MITVKEFFIGRAVVVFCGVLVLVLALFARGMFTGPDAPQDNAVPVFSWEYEEDDTLNPDGFPQTNIFLEVRFPDGQTKRKLIDTTPGSCNALPDAGEDSVTGSSDIQCYSAGLGYRFRIIRGGESYLVQRQEFEEALPGIDPPLRDYVTVSEFPFAS